MLHRCSTTVLHFGRRFFFPLSRNKERLESPVHFSIVGVYISVLLLGEEEEEFPSCVSFFGESSSSRSDKFLIRLSRAAPRTPGASGPGLAPGITCDTVDIVVDSSLLNIV